MRFFTADLHLGHANIISFCARPFQSVEAMNDALLANWAATVGEDDEIWVLGDVAMGSIAQTLPPIASLPGRKHLVPGNHDRCWPGNQRLRPGDEQMYTDVGFAIHPGSVELQLQEVPVVACHFPVAGDSKIEDRFGDHRPEVPEEAWLLHGHVHESWKLNKRQINVGVDVWDFRPVSEEKLLDLMRLEDGAVFP